MGEGTLRLWKIPNKVLKGKEQGVALVSGTTDGVQGEKLEGM